MLRSFNPIILIGAAAFLTSCSTTSEGRKQFSLVSNKRVERDGERAFSRLKNRNIIVEKKSDKDFVNCVISKLKPSFNAQTGATTDWEVAIFKSEDANAFALPGKKIGLNSGLLRVAVNEAQLAAVLAHEIAHVEAEHGRERTSQQVALESLGYVSGILGRSSRGSSKTLATSLTATRGAVQLGLLYPFSKVQEEEADLIGLELMAKAGFDPREALHFWENMEVYGTSGSDSILSTHPSHQSRLKILESRVIEIQARALASGAERASSNSDQSVACESGVL